jgi:hypothetical protein
MQFPKSSGALPRARIVHTNDLTVPEKPYIYF